MPDAARERAYRLRTWYLVHGLAGLGAIFVVFMFALAATYYFTGRWPQFELPLALGYVLGVGMIAVLWLWIRMLVDFFKLRPSRFPVLWGWLLVLGSFLGGVAYFWLVWRPRNAPQTPN